MTTIKKFSTDSGIVGDGITNDSTLTLEGTATANSTVSVYDGTTLLGSATANSSGAWSYTTGTLSNGTHSFTAATTSTTSPSSGFPDASTTGVPAGTSLTTVNGNFTTSYAGQIIDALDVNGAIIVNHPGVIIRNCEATYIDVYGDNCLIEDTTVTGQNAGQSGIDLLGCDNTTVQRCDISGVENGIWLEADGCLIRDNYIHDLRNDVYFDPHFDGLQIGPGTTTANNVITHNNFDLGEGINACIMIEEATNIDISYNRFYGGTYNIYFEDKANTGRMTGCDVTNNVFAYNYYGDVAGSEADAQTYSGNVYGDTAVNTTSTTTTDTSPALLVTVDTVAPTAPTIATPTTNANGGLDLTGTAEANSVVSVYDGTTQLGTATANSSGTWSYTTGVLATGSHNLTAQATDAAGNTGAPSAAVTATTGTSPTAPATPRIDSFSNDSGTLGDGVTSDSTLTLAGTAAANSTVRVFDGSTQIGTATANGSGAWSYTTAPLSDGNHSLTATATNTSGTSAASSSLSVRIDTTAPSAPTIATPTSNANGGLNLTGTAETNSVVNVYDGATLIGTAPTSSSGAWSYTTGTLATGSHSFTARATDAAGNTSAESEVVTASTGTSPTPTPPAIPTIASFSNDSGVAGDRITNDNTLTLTGTTAANSTVNLFDGATQIGTATANSSGIWSYTTGTLSNGAHSFTAATTSTGNSSSGFPDASTTGVPPGTSLTTVNGNFTSSYAGQIIDARDVNGTIIVNHPGVIIRNCEAQYITVNADNCIIEDTTVVGQNMVGSGINLLGSDNTTVQRVDISGVNHGIWLEANGCLIADNYIHGAANNGLQIPEGASISNNVITHNNFDSGAGANASIFVADATNIDITNNRLSGGTYNIYFEGNTTGCDVTNNVFVASVYGDVAGTAEGSQSYSGNVYGDTGARTSTASAITTGSTSAPLVVTVDTAAPAAPTIATPTDNANGGLNLTGTAEVNSVVTVYDGTTQLGTATANSSGAWSYTASNLADGSHSFTSRAVDAAGNTSAPSAALIVNVDTGTEAPTAEAPTVEFGDVRQKWNDKVVFSGSTDPNARITIHDTDGTAVGTAIAGADGKFKLTTSSRLSDDDVHQFTTTVTDSTGQATSSSGSAVLGTNGDDRLTSTSGNDVFRGNGGNDIFEFAANFGRDVITDFGAGRRGHDVVEFSRTVFDDFADVLAHATQNGQDVVIDAGGGNTLTLKNTSLSSLDRTDFHFA